MSTLTNYFFMLFFAGNVLLFIIAIGVMTWALGGLRRYNMRRVAEAAQRHTPRAALAGEQRAEHA